MISKEELNAKRKEFKKELIRLNNITVDYYLENIKDKQPTSNEELVFELLRDNLGEYKQKYFGWDNDVRPNVEPVEKIVENKKPIKRTRRNKNLSILIKNEMLATGKKTKIFVHKTGRYIGKVKTTNEIRDEVTNCYNLIADDKKTKPTRKELINRLAPVDSFSKRIATIVVNEMMLQDKNLKFISETKRRRMEQHYKQENLNYSKYVEILSFISNYQMEQLMEGSKRIKPKIEEIFVHSSLESVAEVNTHIHKLMEMNMIENQKTMYHLPYADSYNAFKKLERKINTEINKKNKPSS